MDTLDFHDFHMPALLADEARHNVLIPTLAAAAAARTAGFLTWTFGDAGRCAVKASGWSIVIGDLARAQCRDLAEQTAKIDFPGVLGPDLTAAWFVERSTELGLAYNDPIPQRIYGLTAPPVYPNAPGEASDVAAGDLDLFADWIAAFHREAVPHDPVPSRQQIEIWAGQGRYLFWTVDGEPVSMACIQRRLPNAAAIAAVYTPSARRGRGYAGCVTAAVVERIFAEGRKTACLYADQRNAAAIRCYTKIGFEPVCESRHFVRKG